MWNLGSSFPLIPCKQNLLVVSPLCPCLDARRKPNQNKDNSNAKKEKSATKLHRININNKNFKVIDKSATGTPKMTTEWPLHNDGVKEWQRNHFISDRRNHGGGGRDGGGGSHKELNGEAEIWRWRIWESIDLEKRRRSGRENKKEASMNEGRA